ncbi:hypothetical protein D918_03619 [Trichuris suis]|nr:hypothetical protein D918_03619 [Trichuris suis]
MRYRDGARCVAELIVQESENTKCREIAFQIITSAHCDAVQTDPFSRALWLCMFNSLSWGNYSAYM